jgi:hypothetical protein
MAFNPHYHTTDMIGLLCNSLCGGLKKKKVDKQLKKDSE